MKFESDDGTLKLTGRQIGPRPFVLLLEDETALGLLVYDNDLSRGVPGATVLIPGLTGYQVLALLAGVNKVLSEPDKLDA